jgi:uncharacterized protein Yka (UPF0111/DUF47 family)
MQEKIMVDLEEKYAMLDKKIALIEQKLDIIQNNHLEHLQSDVNDIKRYFGWGIGVVFIQLVAVIAFLVQNG